MQQQRDEQAALVSKQQEANAASVYNVHNDSGGPLKRSRTDALNMA